MARTWRKETIVKNTTNTTELKSRRLDVLKGIKQDVKLLARDGFIRVTEKRLTTEAATEEGHWQMCRLALLVGQQIVHASPSVVSFLHLL